MIPARLTIDTTDHDAMARAVCAFTIGLDILQWIDAGVGQSGVLTVLTRQGLFDVVVSRHQEEQPT